MRFIRTGDTVKMISGKDRGKTGKVLFVLPDSGNHGRIVIEGLNKIKRHTKPRQQGQKGQIVEKERAVDISNIQLICPKCSKAVRVGVRVEGEKRVRTCKKCNDII